MFLFTECHTNESSLHEWEQEKNFKSMTEPLLNSHKGHGGKTKFLSKLSAYKNVCHFSTPVLSPSFPSGL